MLDGFPTKFAPGERFSYCNGGYVVLALIAERASGVPFHDLVRTPRVRAGRDARHRVPALRRAARRAPRSATSTIDGACGPTSSTSRSGAPATAGSTRPSRTSARFWRALFAGRIVSPDWVAEMVRPRSDVPPESMRYGLGFWLHQSSDAVILVGYDAGVSFRSVHDPAELTHTVISNTTDGAWPIARLLLKRFST